MMPPISIDGTDITGATIDGTDVQEITVDGDTVFTSGFDNYIFDDFNDNDLTRPRTGQEDGNYTADDGTVLNDARIRPDWNVLNGDFFTTGGELKIDRGGLDSGDEDGIVTPSSIQPPCTITFDWRLPTDNNEGDSMVVGLSSTPTGHDLFNNNGIAFQFRSTTDSSVLVAEGSFDTGSLPASNGFVEFIIEDGFQQLTLDGTVLISSNFNITQTFSHFFISKFDDDAFQNDHFIDNLALF